MKHEKLADALNEISDRHIQEAAHQRKRRPNLWPGTVAAILALCIVALPLLHRPSVARPPLFYDPTADSTPSNSQSVHYRFLAASPEYPTLSAYPKEAGTGDYQQWWEDQQALHDQPEGYADNLEGYFASILPTLLQTDGQSNTVCSPLNIYMALAMLAEITDGESRQQILDLLKADSMDALRTQAGQVWKAHYNDDGLSKSILGSSLWLEEGLPYNEDTVRCLAEHYYASVFRGDLGSEDMNQELRTWINAQTEGLLQEHTDDLQLSPASVLALATTICYQAQWQEDFNPKNNTQSVFHTAAGDQTLTFMNRQLSYGPYFWGDTFSAVYLSLEDGSRMWLILPDAGYSPADILEDAADFLAQHPASSASNYKNKSSVRVNLSLPKFDISQQMELSDTLKNLGVTDIFDGSVADFTPIIPQDDGGWIDRVTHAARVMIDEEGVTAAAFTLIERCGSGIPLTDEIDFVLDRPFLFYVESADNLPLFTGIVNQP